MGQINDYRLNITCTIQNLNNNFDAFDFSDWWWSIMI